MLYLLTRTESGIAPENRASALAEQGLLARTAAATAPITVGAYVSTMHPFGLGGSVGGEPRRAG